LSKSLLDIGAVKDWAYHLLPVLKPFGFKDEKEFRLIYIPKEDNALKENYYLRNGLKKCYEFPLASELISEIILGPKCAITPKEIVTFFNIFGLIINENQVVKSKLSYI